MITSTTYQLEGYRIIEYKGLVTAQPAFKTAGSYKRLLEDAEKLGANAVIGIRFNDMWYGTAVVVKPV
ncbi:MAG: hypothetical protein HY811_06645 [Planctomycetes bacterium]|nr:hypothetical protein [Planctomycetota bacterium]